MAKILTYSEIPVFLCKIYLFSRKKIGVILERRETFKNFRLRREVRAEKLHWIRLVKGGEGKIKAELKG